MQIAVGASGMESSAFLKGDDKDQIRVTRDGIDVAKLTKLLRKKFGYAILVSVLRKKTNQEAHHEDHQNKAAEMLQKTLENLVEALSSKKDNTDKINACIEVHQKALDDLVNVNVLSLHISSVCGVGLRQPEPTEPRKPTRMQSRPWFGKEAHHLRS
ncbi:hypothetical protein LWI28_015417 [Acer negundo]|uniref:Uncharacterized protein n=1 Tax=Acer negundo TaxID=4023 RepID=A0AAD5IFD0_ACENE|nr:hypothetical protein LWI28_015417 [Acer negundo]